MSELERRPHVQKPREELVYQHSHMPGGEQGTFQDQIQDASHKAPWFAVSVGFHALLYFILMNVVWSQVAVSNERVLVGEVMPDDIEVIEELPPPDIEEKPVEIEKVIEDPVVTENDVEELADEQDQVAPLKAPFEGRSLNDVIGAGGGAGGPGGRLGRRGSGQAGGSAHQRSVALGLEWLKNHQDPAGYWDSDEFSNHCKLNLCDGKGHAGNDVGLTGLALLAFMGAGNTTNTGKYKRVVNSGVKYLVQIQDADDGCFAPKSGQHFMYGHALAALALVEAYHLSKAPHLKTPAQRGLDFIGISRNPYKAWRYAYPPDGDNDVSVSGWMLFALFGGKDAGLTVDDAAIKDGMAYISEMTDKTTWRTGYRETGSPPAREPEDLEIWPQDRSESMTAVAMLVRMFNQEDPGKSQALKGGATLLQRSLPTWDEAGGSIDFYYWYYGSYSMWQMGGRYWKDWQNRLLDSVVHNQRPDGDEEGSWDPQVDPWGENGGRVYATAINTLSLEVYYRYDKLFGAR